MKKVLLFMLILLLGISLYGCDNNQLVNEKSLVQVTDNQQLQSLISEYKSTIKNTSLNDQQNEGYKGNVAIKFKSNVKELKGDFSLDIKIFMDKNLNLDLTANGSANLELKNKKFNATLNSNIISDHKQSFHDLQYKINLDQKKIGESTKFKKDSLSVLFKDLDEIKIPIAGMEIFIDNTEMFDVYTSKKDESLVYLKVKKELITKEMISELIEPLKMIGMPKIKNFAFNNNDKIIFSFKRENKKLVFKGLEYKLNLSIVSSHDEKIEVGINATFKESKQNISLPDEAKRKEYNGKSPDNIIDIITGAFITP